MSIKLDGKAFSKEILEKIKFKCKDLGRKPSLTVVLVGNNPSSKIYVSVKERACSEVGISFKKILLDETISERELIHIIHNINIDENIDGLIVQLPLPKTIDENRILSAIDPKKDVDGFHALNYGNLLLNRDFMSSKEFFTPCTPTGVIMLLDRYKIDLSGKKALVIGRSNVVGKGIALMLMHRDATVTIAHSKTKKLDDLILESDIIVSCVGKPHFIKNVKENSILVDVGITKIENKLFGDIDPKLYDISEFYTPVPGGIGPMTVAILLSNVIKSYLINQ
jgi:methylenetetrahydrofolate dehydrogenase (NADP+)/methenyltetrahydrofolate cyclohydrolase